MQTEGSERRRGRGSEAQVGARRPHRPRLVAGEQQQKQQKRPPRVLRPPAETRTGAETLLVTGGGRKPSSGQGVTKSGACPGRPHRGLTLDQLGVREVLLVANTDEILPYDTWRVKARRPERASKRPLVCFFLFYFFFFLLFQVKVGVGNSPQLLFSGAPEAPLVEAVQPGVMRRRCRRLLGQQDERDEQHGHAEQQAVVRRAAAAHAFL